MTLMNIVKPAALVLMLAVPASAQTPGPRNNARQSSITTSDIQRLQDEVYDASNELSRLRNRDQATAERLQSQLDDLRDEVVYLRVKLRKEGSVSRADYNDVRNHVQSVRSEARGTSSQNDNVRQGNATWQSGGSGRGAGYGTGTSGSGGYGGAADSQ